MVRETGQKMEQQNNSRGGQGNLHTNGDGAQAEGCEQTVSGGHWRQPTGVPAGPESPYTGIARIVKT